MPYGSLNPLANVATCCGLPSAVIPRKTLMSPASLSATKKSPLGAVTIKRGLFRPLAYSWTVNPGGAVGHALLGRLTTSGPLFG